MYLSVSVCGLLVSTGKIKETADAVDCAWKMAAGVHCCSHMLEESNSLNVADWHQSSKSNEAFLISASNLAQELRPFGRI